MSCFSPVSPSVFDNGSERDRKDKIEEAYNASDGEKKSNLTFLGRSCGIFLGGDGCQVRATYNAPFNILGLG